MFLPHLFNKEKLITKIRKKQKKEKIYKSNLQLNIRFVVRKHADFINNHKQNSSADATNFSLSFHYCLIFKFLAVWQFQFACMFCVFDVLSTTRIYEIW